MWIQHGSVYVRGYNIVDADVYIYVSYGYIYMYMYVVITMIHNVSSTMKIAIWGGYD